MTAIETIMETYPLVRPFLEHMPEELKSRFTVRIYPAGSIIHQKQLNLKHFGIICDGETRVINEFESGNVFMIEKNDPIDFIGEVTILANKEETSVTIEALTKCTVLMFTRKDFEFWITQDLSFLRLVSEKVAFKLYRSSFNRGARLFYPPNFLLLDYLLKFIHDKKLQGEDIILIPKRRQEISEELGMTVKTINRTVQKFKEEDLLSIVKGKICLTQEQYQRGKRELVYYRK